MRLPGTSLAIAGVIVVADQAAKAAIRVSVPLHSSRTVIPGFLDLTHVQNSGAAFGILNAADFPYKAAVIAVIATVALASIALFAAGLSPHQRLAKIGLALILGGAAGNLIDRVATGYVVDFVDVYWREYHFWAFNVADSAITLGVIAMMIDMIGLGRHVSTTT
jgi:signal peptidase II